MAVPAYFSAQPHQLDPRRTAGTGLALVAGAAVGVVMFGVTQLVLRSPELAWLTAGLRGRRAAQSGDRMTVAAPSAVLGTGQASERPRRLRLDLAALVVAGVCLPVLTGALVAIRRPSALAVAAVIGLSVLVWRKPVDSGVPDHRSDPAGRRHRPRPDRCPYYARTKHWPSSWPASSSCGSSSTTAPVRRCACGSAGSKRRWSPSRSAVRSCRWPGCSCRTRRSRPTTSPTRWCCGSSSASTASSARPCTPSGRSGSAWRRRSASAVILGVIGILQTLDVPGIRTLLMTYWAPFGFEAQL